ncbi:MAG TPA: HlyD family secretion protein, partial [Bauldia sp.]|nr:HlyD family secretion protein [Bauldia sp.]
MSADGGDKRPADARTAQPAMRAEPPVPPSPPEPPKKNNRNRFLLMAAVPVVIILIGGYFWLTGGRYASTDNAYVQQDRVTVTPQVSGTIVDAPVGENAVVKAGDVLFKIDDRPYKIALASADAALASARLQVEELRAGESAAVAAVSAAQDNVNFYQKDFDRQQGLLSKGVSSQADYDQAEQDLHNAQQALEQAKEHEESTLAALGGNANIATDDHPMVKAAQAARDQAALNLANTVVTAPSDGVVAQSDKLLVGQQVSPSVAVMSLVETSSSYVEANFKETDLARMHAGQSAEVAIDAYPGQKFKAEVASIGAGTGAEFSLLPAQNATGNWVKVTQRVPVRVRFLEDVADLPP